MRLPCNSRSMPCCPCGARTPCCGPGTAESGPRGRHWGGGAAGARRRRYSTSTKPHHERGRRDPVEQDHARRKRSARTKGNERRVGGAASDVEDAASGGAYRRARAPLVQRRRDCARSGRGGVPTSGRTDAWPDRGVRRRTVLHAVARLLDATQRVPPAGPTKSEEHTSELQSHSDIVCRLLLEKKKTIGSHSDRACYPVTMPSWTQDDDYKGLTGKRLPRCQPIRDRARESGWSSS